MKKYVAILGSGMFFVICVSLYLMMESVNTPDRSRSNLDELAINNIETKIKQIESDLSSNQETINVIKDSIRDLATGNVKDGASKLKNMLNKLDTITVINQIKGNASHAKIEEKPKKSSPISTDMCSKEEPKKTDIQMVDVYEQLPFDNPDGGVWKQGYAIHYDVSRWQTRNLRVFVVPHSHNDPGWLKTFEKYYSDQTRNIFNNMVTKLEQHEKMKFIYAEMSFFSLWWDEISSDMKNRVKKLIERGKLEIVTGGWVMTDEANAHYFAMLDQLIEGNQWLLNQVGVTPTSCWAIDPFGHSPTMAYLLKRMGFSNMLIQRTHYAIKKYLSKSQQLEFHWRQNWDTEGSTDMTCHMMPFYSYDVPHTCGPDPSICCQFDFKRLPGGKINCPWRKPPKPIIQANVKERAEVLLDQYRKKAQLYKTNVVLIPLGDDFRYDTPLEWDNQYNNYQQMFDHMNSQPDLHVQAQFGTLSDYFTALHDELQSSSSDLPSLAGDFFSYSDRDDHYWTGYFTSRPFQKRLDRVMEAHLRGGDILFSQAMVAARKQKITNFPSVTLAKKITEARRALGLFQHHDAITGTAKDFVVNDYGNKLLSGLNGMKTVIKESAQLLLSPDQYSPQSVFDVDEVRVTHDALPDRTVIKLTAEPQPVVFYNSLAHSRQNVVRLYVDSQHLQVLDSQGNVVETQVDPFWTGNLEYSFNTFKVMFVASVPALGLSKYTISTATDNKLNTLSKVTLLNAGGGSKTTGELFAVDNSATGDVTMENQDVKVSVSRGEGTLQSVTLKETGHTVKAKVTFLTYGTVNKKDKSGAYLFMPDGPAKPLYSAVYPLMRFVHGPIMSEVHSTFQHVEHVIRLQNSPGVDSLAVDINNIIDIRPENNKELVMRVETDINNNDGVFYTDLNGYQIQRRKHYDKLPLQANFYPMPSAMFIEDQQHRFTVLSSQSLGASSLKPGWLEIVQDRRLMQDDNRGLQQGVVDNRRSPNRFRLLVEKRLSESEPPKKSHGFLSLVGQVSSQELIHPIHVLPKLSGSGEYRLRSSHEPLSSDFACDMHLVNWRTLFNEASHEAGDTSSFILHRYGLDCSFPTKAQKCTLNNGKVDFKKLLRDVSVETVTSTSLNLIHDNPEVTGDVLIKPMEIQAFKVTLK